MKWLNVKLNVDVLMLSMFIYIQESMGFSGKCLCLGFFGLFGDSCNMLEY